MNYSGGVNVTDDMLITVTLPPSTNARMGVSRGGQMFLTSKARTWMRDTERGLREWALGRKPINEYAFIDLWFVLPRSNCDSHNYFKCLFDALENAGLVTDDKYLIPRVHGVGHDSKNPCVVMRIVR